VNIDRSSGLEGDADAMVGGRPWPVVDDPGMSIGSFLSNPAGSNSRCATRQGPAVAH
jgi:hypothetical protein